MDTQDISNESQFLAHLRQVERRQKEALRMKGQLVRDHPPAEKLISKHMMSSLMSSMASSSLRNNYTMALSQLPPAYPPCIRPVSELEPMAISDMRLETHHRGKMILIRVRTPPNRITAVMTIVEDEEGTAVVLQLYHQPDESMVPAEEVLQPDDVFILKEPFFKRATDGSYSLRVDHPGDIVRLESNDERIPSKWRSRPLMHGQTSKHIRLQGNEATRREQWAVAERLYTAAIQTASTTEEIQLAHLNRSLANLRLGRPELALSDAKKASDTDSPSEKGLFRQARALYELRDFKQSLGALQRLLACHPENQAAKIELGRTQARLLEQETGEYDFRNMYKQAQQTPPAIDCATFSRLVEIRTSPGRGFGLFTTAAVSAGQLLLCEKAFEYTHVDEDGPRRTAMLMDMSTKKGSMGGQAGLLTQLVQKLHHSRTALAQYTELYHGNYAAPPVSEMDGFPVVDSFLVQTSVQAKFATCGIWLLASRINHSCLGNCRRSFIGDMQIVRAASDLPAGTELLFSYRSPEVLESYDDVQKGLSAWGFRCSCALCLSRKDTSKSALNNRRNLLETLKNMPDGIESNPAKAERLLGQMEKTYPSAWPEVPRLEMRDAYIALGFALLAKGKPAEAIKMVVRGLECLGFKIAATTLTSNGEPPGLVVVRWGKCEDWTPFAFLQLYLAYAKLAPDVCAAAKRCAGIAYRIVVGEDETLCETFPDLL
ncbi:SET domain-containing protein [Sodiomyces alkalinus F11]|uniref:SET domain-containing protein n=1 Tax=Sodiomyces alkalinus (strain CBS 110278 / VKM F-3762 / F11) TaxID=1314773 RepID=A0A3N2PTY3_SODAK|nr:SET domain-containing protein [Sodiomyces alkalinus F11]ROT37968.1 SET domain-containing protein [Sodiomyces alkalinus F11]